ncbi:uncharacterized protein LOC135467808 isoform X2 [Liolophura sinensis]|uniref:uncharacterized protein LOC135467808 isoform X2 n=1 Tax=Liolophura sinensis TaxID=3198878 RepID=UPI003159682E
MENYETVCKLGTGACGSVSLVRNKTTKLLCALKMIQLDKSKRTRTKEAVLKEAKILAKLKHPHIVSYHESFFDADETYLYIVQDYCDGGTLEDKMTEAIKWFIQIVMAAQHMHSNKILHRDLKSANVFLTKKGVVKLGDFGISKSLDTTIEMTSTVVGTPCYLSPELCQDIPYSSKSDIWAIGCLLYELCALKPAFDAQNLISLFMKIVKGEFSPVPDQYSSDLRDLVGFILNKSPEERPSASAILNHTFIQEHLATFIEEKEYLLKQKIIKDSQQQLSPLGSDRLTENVKEPGVRACSPNIHSASQPPPPETSVVTSDSGVALDGAVKGVKDVEEGMRDDGSDYSDDFDSSDEEPEAKAIPDPGSCDCPVDVSGLCEEYDDDFEEDDSFAEDLDDIVSQAREAQGVAVEDEYVVDEDTDRCSLRQQWYNVLGEEKFEEMKKIVCSEISSDGTRLSVLRRVGEDNAEVCYLTCDEEKEDLG